MPGDEARCVTTAIQFCQAKKNVYCLTTIEKRKEKERKERRHKNPEPIVQSLSSTSGGIAEVAATLVARDRWPRYLPR